jgi:hypothetical protein
MVYRYRFLFPGSAAGLSRVVEGIICSCGIGISAVALADFLVCPGSFTNTYQKTRWVARRSELSLVRQRQIRKRQTGTG